MTGTSPSPSESSSSKLEALPKQLKRKLDDSDDSESSESYSYSESDGEDDNGLRTSNDRLEDSSDGEESAGDGEEAEVKVLSHKEQRRLKKKQKLVGGADEQPAAGASNTISKTKQKKQKKEETQNKRQNSVWVGNLSFKTTPDSLRGFFEGVGEITRVHMPTKVGANGKEGKSENRGFAYVDFATADAKTIAITLSEKNLDGRRLLIKDGDDFAGRPAPPAAAADANGDITMSSTQSTGGTTGLPKSAQKILSAQKQPPGPCLFLGNLGFETTDESIRQMMEGHAKGLAQRQKMKAKKKKKEGKDDDLTGEKIARGDEGSDEKEGTEIVDVGIRKVRMGTFEDSGLCKGFAFVDFTSTPHATAALTNSRNHFLNGRKLVVEYASPDAVRRGGHWEKGEGSGRGKVIGDRSRQSRRPQRKERLEQKQKERGEQPEQGLERIENEDGGSARAPSRTYERTYERGPRRDDRNPKFQRRTKPGAALALAKRESVAIVPSEGTRIVFS